MGGERRERWIREREGQREREREREGLGSMKRERECQYGREREEQRQNRGLETNTSFHWMPHGRALKSLSLFPEFHHIDICICAYSVYIITHMQTLQRLSVTYT